MKENLNNVRQAITNRLESGLCDGVYTAASALVTYRSHETAEYLCGRVNDTPNETPIGPDTLFDIASLTKPLVTATGILNLFDSGALDPSVNLGDIFEDTTFGDPRLAAVTVHQLLTHTSGLAAIPSVGFQEMASNRQWLAAALRMPLSDDPGAVYRYSDLGYILLGAIVERASKESLAAFARRSIFELLGMSNTSYLPPSDRPIVATNPGRPTGTVHDPAAAAMGGVAGHAGVFSTTADLARFLAAIATDGAAILSPDSLARMRTNQIASDIGHQSYGWFLPGAPYFPAGGPLSVAAYAHSGFTGCLMGVDPGREATFVLLTNRIYASPDDNRRYLAFRHAFVDDICRYLPVKE